MGKGRCKAERPSPRKLFSKAVLVQKLCCYASTAKLISNKRSMLDQTINGEAECHSVWNKIDGAEETRIHCP